MLSSVEEAGGTRSLLRHELQARALEGAVLLRLLLAALAISIRAMRTSACACFDDTHEFFSTVYLSVSVFMRMICMEYAARLKRKKILAGSSLHHPALNRAFLEPCHSALVCTSAEVHAPPRTNTGPHFSLLEEEAGELLDDCFQRL